MRLLKLALLAAAMALAAGSPATRAATPADVLVVAQNIDGTTLYDLQG